MSLSPDEQKKYDLSNQVAIALNGLAGSNIDRVRDVQSQPFTLNNIDTRLQQRYGGNNPFQLKNGPEGGGAGSVSGAGEGVQRSLDYSGLTRLPGTDDFGAEARRMSDSVYAQAASRLNPQFQQRESDMRSRLAAQGISENSDAYRRELDNEARARTDAYNDADYRAIQAGSAEQSRIFGLALGARQQGQNEVNTQGAFVNDAQQQVFGQRLAGQDQANSANAQNFSQRQAAVALNNANQNQYFNQAGAVAAFNNNARQQEIEEKAYFRNLPINDIAALLGTGPGVADPNFNPVSQVGVAAPDYQGIVQNNYAQAMNLYNQQQAARSSALGSIFGAAGSLGSAAILSDRRFKENVRRIGTLANGIATYTWNYVGDKLTRFGVMAQEVLGIRPDAVQDVNGVLHVNYQKVF